MTHLIILDLKDYKHHGDFGNAKCPKFNLVGPEEINNLELAEIIAVSQGKKLNYEMLDFHSSRPGHDLRYGLDGNKMKKMGWSLPVDFETSLRNTVRWTVDNQIWLND